MQNNLANTAVEIAGLVEQKKFDEACSSLKRYKDADLSVELLLLKATSIQLAEDSAGFTLDDARASLVQASVIGSQRVEVWIDLGHFYFAVDDQPHKALSCFEKAKTLCSVLCKDLILGEAKTLLELDRKDDALVSLQSFGEAITSREILQLEKEILGNGQVDERKMH